MKRVFLAAVLSLAMLSTMASTFPYPTIDSWFMPQPQDTYGNAVWYGPFVMEGTARYRGLSLDGFRDGVALMSPADMGKTVWLRRPGQAWEGPFRVVDCAQQDDIYWITKERHEVVEVGFPTALAWGMVSGDTESYSVNQWRIEDVEVWIGGYPPFLPTYPIYYPDWWLERSEMVPTVGNRPLAIPPDHWKFADGSIRGPEDFPNMPTWYYYLAYFPIELDLPIRYIPQ